ncbi:unnamed protein product, partial [Oppiella nova]
MSARPLTSESDDYEDVEETDKVKTKNEVMGHHYITITPRGLSNLTLYRYEIKTEKSGVLNIYVQGNIASITLTTPLYRYEIKTEKSGVLNIYVQGNIASITLTTPVFMTVHDLGSNHTEFHKLVEHPCMAKLKARSVWIHVDLPGQEFDAPDLPEGFTFPSMDQIADDLL